MDKLKMSTPDLTDKNVEQIGMLFPNVITEVEDGTTKDTKGHEIKKYKKVVDFDLLKQVLSKNLVEDDNERYRLDWPGKKASLLKANTPITKTLRPCLEESSGKDGNPGKFDSENLYIEGDNFEVLKILQESYLGKIKMIYIDPPYNTGTAMIYHNDFSKSENEYDEEIGAVDEEGGKLFRNTESNGRFHSDWLSMMYQRLIVSRDLLTNDGFISIAIDHNELHSLTSICDEIFSEENRIGLIAVRNNPAGRSTAKGVSITNEYLLLYAKSDKSTLCRLARNEKQINRYSEKDDVSAFEWVNFRKPGSKKSESPKMYYPIFVSQEKLRVPNIEWNKHSEEWDLKEEPLENEFIVYPIDDDGKDRRWRWAVETLKVGIKELKPRFMKNTWHVYLKSRIPNDGILPSTWWDKNEYSSTAYGTNFLKDVFGELQIFSFPKSIYAVMDALRIMSDNPSDIILDFFSGSATTAHAVMQLNAEDGGKRKFIMVQLPEPCDETSEAFKAGYKTIPEIGKERIRRAGKKILEEATTKNTKGTKNEEENNLFDNESLSNVSSVSWLKNLDIGFRVYKTDSTNMKDVYYHPSELKQDQLSFLESNIKEDRTPEDLLTQVILDLGLELTLPIETKKIHGNTVFIVQTNALVACFDKDIDFKIVDTISDLKPLKVVFKDASFKDDKDRINVEERFKRLSPETKVTVI